MEIQKDVSEIHEKMILILEGGISINPYVLTQLIGSGKSLADALDMIEETGNKHSEAFNDAVEKALKTQANDIKQLRQIEECLKTFDLSLRTFKQKAEDGTEYIRIVAAKPLKVWLPETGNRPHRVVMCFWYKHGDQIPFQYSTHKEIFPWKRSTKKYPKPFLDGGHYTSSLAHLEKEFEGRV